MTKTQCDGCGTTERVCVLLPAGEVGLVLVALCEPCMGWLRDGSHPLATPDEPAAWVEQESLDRLASAEDGADVTLWTGPMGLPLIPLYRRGKP